MKTTSLQNWIRTGVRENGEPSTVGDPTGSADGWPLPQLVELERNGSDSRVRHQPYVWKAPRKSVGEPKTAASKGVLGRFVRLAYANDSRVVDFVRKFGPLNLCQHGLPDTHAGLFRCQDDVETDEENWQRYGSRSEPLKTYRRYARLVAATLRAAEDFRSGMRFHVEDLEIIANHWKSWNLQLLHGRPKKQRPQMALANYAPDFNVVLEQIQPGQREANIVNGATSIVNNVVNWWLDAGVVTARLRLEIEYHPPRRYTPRQPANVVWESLGRYPTTWAAIGTQLLFAALRERNVAYCAHCGREVHRDRRPRTDRRVWCDSIECKRARERWKKRRSRAKNAGNNKADS